jgi:hypothetical protein
MLWRFAMVTMTTTTTFSHPVRALAAAWGELACLTASGRMNVFLDCEEGIAAMIRPELDFADYVDTRQDADLCVRATPEASEGPGRQYHLSFIGEGMFDEIESGAGLVAA